MILKKWNLFKKHLAVVAGCFFNAKIKYGSFKGIICGYFAEMPFYYAKNKEGEWKDEEDWLDQKAYKP